MDGGISEVDERGDDFAVAANLVQLARIPQGHDGADKLDKVLAPFPVLGRAATCICVSVTAAMILAGVTYGCLCRGT